MFASQLNITILSSHPRDKDIDYNPNINPVFLDNNMDNISKFVIYF